MTSNDDVLGRCLMPSLRPMSSALYQVMAAQVVEAAGLKSTAVHLGILPASHVDGALQRLCRWGSGR